MKSGVLVVQVNGSQQQSSSRNSNTQSGLELSALLVTENNVKRHTGGVNHGKFIQQLELVPQSHMEHPGSKSNNEKANGRKNDGGMVLLSVNVDNRVQSHKHEDGVGGGVHDFGHILADDVVFLAPVNGGSSGAPVAHIDGRGVGNSSRQHFRDNWGWLRRLRLYHAKCLDCMHLCRSKA